MVHVGGSRAHRVLGGAAVPILLATLLLGSIAGTPPFDAHPPATDQVASLRAADLSAPGGAPHPAATPDLSPVSVGDVATSVMVNYNASWPGDFLSSVDDLSVGPGAFVPSTGYLWLSDLPSATVPGAVPRFAPALLFDPENNSFQGIVPQLANTSDLVYDPANGLLYSADPLNDTVGVFDPATDSWAAPAIPVGSEPVALALDGVTGSLFVANYGSSNLSVIDTTTNQVAGTSPSTGTDPFALALDSTNQTLFVACAGSEFLTVINATTVVSVPVPTFALGGVPAGLAFSSSTGTVAASVPSRSMVAVFNVTNAGPTTIRIGAGVGALIALPTNSDYLVANSTGSNLAQLDPITDTVVNSSIPVGEGPKSFDEIPTDRSVYVWSAVSRNLSLVWSGEALRSVSSASLAAEPSALAYDPDSGRLLVANSNDSTVSFLSPSSLRTVAPPLPLSSPPISLASDPGDGVVYAGLEGGLATIDPATASEVTSNDLLSGATEAMVVDSPDHILWALNSVHGLVGYDLPDLSTTVTPGIGAGQSGIRSLAIDPTTDELFLPVNTSGTSAIAVVDAATGATVDADVVSAPDLTSIAYDPADGCVYALGENISIVNATTLSLVFTPLTIAPHVGAGAIAYDPSRGYLYASTWPASDLGTLTAVDGQSVEASYAGETAMGVGHSPVAVLPLPVPGGSSSTPSEIWVANALAGTLSVVASSPPEIASFAAVPGTIEVGQNTTFVVTYTGGAGPVVVSYAGLPAGCASSNTTQLRCAPSAPGAYTVTVTVTDGLGGTAQSNASLNVDSGVAIHVESSTPLPYVEQGTLFAIFLTAGGGVAPYNYSWSWGDGGLGWGQTPYHIYRTVGTFVITLNVTDQLGGRASMSWPVDVYAPPALQGYASATNTDVGRSVYFTAVVTGGAGGGGTLWSFGDDSTGIGANVSHSWTAPGVYNVTATYTDNQSNRASWSTQVYVSLAPAGEFVVTAASAPSPAQPGTLFYYNATLDGGTAPYAVVWHFGDGSEASGLHVTHAYSAAGNYSINVDVTDAAGAPVNATLAVEVVAGPSTTGGSTLNFSLGLLLGLVVGAALAAVLVFVATARRRTKRKSPPPPSPYVPPARQAWKED